MVHEDKDLATDPAKKRISDPREEEQARVVVARKRKLVDPECEFAVLEDEELNRKDASRKKRGTW